MMTRGSDESCSFSATMVLMDLMRSGFAKTHWRGAGFPTVVHVAVIHLSVLWQKPVDVSLGWWRCLDDNLEPASRNQSRDGNGPAGLTPSVPIPKPQFRVFHSKSLDGKGKLLPANCEMAPVHPNSTLQKRHPPHR